jgi:plastocyanin
MRALTAARAGRLALAVIVSAVLVPAAPAAAARKHTIGAFFIDYLPDNLTINKGDSLTFANTDPFAGVGHSVTHATPPGVAPGFDSEVIPFGGTAEVAGVTQLDQGEYLFWCRVHSIMRGVLYVGAESRPPTETVTDLVDDFLP